MGWNLVGWNSGGLKFELSTFELWQVYDSTLLNCEIQLNEVRGAIKNLKLGKAFLEVPNEALKNEQATLLLHKFFNICFSFGLSPTEWDKSDIKPIKKPDKDERIPLQLLLCVVFVNCTHPY